VRVKGGVGAYWEKFKTPPLFNLKMYLFSYYIPDCK